MPTQIFLTMDQTLLTKKPFCKLFICIALLFGNILYGQVSQGYQHLYRPKTVQPDTTPDNYKQQTAQSDTINGEQVSLDSIRRREAFVRDSIEKRMAFVRDSLLRRKQIRDSVHFLKNNLPRLINASLRTNTNEIILPGKPVMVIGDSILTDYVYQKLIFSFSDPYRPWESSINLSTKPVRFKVDTVRKVITYLKSNKIYHKYYYKPGQRVLKIVEGSIVLNKPQGKFYNLPIDSVFFDGQGRVLKIKRYDHYHQVKGSYQKGPSLFTHLKQVRQYEYSGNRISKYEVVDFCNRWKVQDPRKVCKIVRYTVTGLGNKYILDRRNDPPNTFSDGRFIFEFDNSGNFKSAEFKNLNNSEDWKTHVEVNDKGHVSRYIYTDKGKVYRTLLVKYNDNPRAKYKIETISCYFEDKIDYRQVNNMTGKQRTRDRMTLEWSEWH